jgi:hypothetical protein
MFQILFCIFQDILTFFANPNPSHPQIGFQKQHGCEFSKRKTLK